MPQRSEVTWRSLRFWQELFVFMWSVALAANWFEIALKGLIGLIRGNLAWSLPFTAQEFFTFQEPYALGTAAILLIVVPLRDRFGLGHVRVFLVSAVVTGLIEAMSGLALILVFGANTWWDYSWLPFSFDGYTSLAAMSIFGLLATGFLAYVHPAIQPLLRRLPQRRLTLAVSALVVLYLVSVLVKFMANGWL